MERQQELPFDSDRKLMSTVYALHGVPTLLTKGAPDVLLERAVYLRKKQGIRRMTEEDRTEILEQNQRFSCCLSNIPHTSLFCHSYSRIIL